MNGSPADAFVSNACGTEQCKRLGTPIGAQRYFRSDPASDRCAEQMYRRNIKSIEKIEIEHARSPTEPP